MARQDRSAESAKLSRLEDAMHVLGMTSAPRSRGRKAKGYYPIRTLQDIRGLIQEGALNMDRRSDQGPGKI